MAQFLKSSIGCEAHCQPDWEHKSSSRTKALSSHTLSRKYSIPSGFGSTNPGHPEQISMLCLFSPVSNTCRDILGYSVSSPKVYKECCKCGASGAQENLQSPQTTKQMWSARLPVPNGAILVRGRQSDRHLIPDSSRISNILNLRKDKNL